MPSQRNRFDEPCACKLIYCLDGHHLIGARSEHKIYGVKLTTEIPAKLMLALVLDALPVGLFWKDRDSRILGCNQKFADDSGVSNPVDMIGKTNFDFYPIEQAEAYRADDLEVMGTGQSKLGIEEPLLLANGNTAWVETNKVAMRNSTGEVIGVLATYKDVTERRRASEERARFNLELAVAKQATMTAMHDALTGLPNRRLLEEELKARHLSSLPNKRLAIVALDLDRFKTTNDLHGHAVGDELLQKVAQLLSDEVGANSFIARVGGDEFILLLDFESDASLNAQLSALITKFDAPLTLAEHEITVRATLGIAIMPNDGVDPDILMRHSDMALYSAKQQGRARFEFFKPVMQTRAEERVLLERDLRIAIESDQIIPYFQPVKHLKSGNVLGYEILARWPHAERGLIQPGEFIKIAEETGLIGQLTMNLLRRGCGVAKRWPGAPRIGINISPIQLRDIALPQKLLMVLSECGFPPGRLLVEITEDALVSDTKTAKAILSSLKNLGVRIALDDFGIGYSSLQNLLDLPLNTLKIDQSFVRSMTESDNALMIVKAIVQLAKDLHLDLVAEGIETESQALALIAIGCVAGQGFYLGRPSPLFRNASSPTSLIGDEKGTAKISA
jgi:diguanylate cyclase (GGDEF)-like protein/PAS domain S-box-containing protein